MTTTLPASSLTRINDHYDELDGESSNKNGTIAGPIGYGGNSCGTMMATVSPLEAESIISSIKHFPIQEIF